MYARCSAPVLLFTWNKLGAVRFLESGGWLTISSFVLSGKGLLQIKQAGPRSDPKLVILVEWRLVLPVHNFPVRFPVIGSSALTIAF